MLYINNETQEIITAYQILYTGYNGTNYWIQYLTDQGGGLTIGLYPEQTANYTPQEGDFYIDNGAIIDSIIMNQADFNNNYTMD